MVKAFLVLVAWCAVAGGPVLATTHTVEMTAVEKDVVVDGDGTTYAAWTFNGQVQALWCG